MEFRHGLRWRRSEEGRTDGGQSEQRNEVAHVGSHKYSSNVKAMQFNQLMRVVARFMSKHCYPVKLA
jgi:hypothetical protein